MEDQVLPTVVVGSVSKPAETPAEPDAALDVLDKKLNEAELLLARLEQAAAEEPTKIAANDDAASKLDAAVLRALTGHVPNAETADTLIAALKQEGRIRVASDGVAEVAVGDGMTGVG